MMATRGAPSPLGIATIDQLTLYANATNTTVLLYVNFPSGLCAYRITPDKILSSLSLDGLDTITSKLAAMQRSMRLAEQATKRAPIQRGLNRVVDPIASTAPPLPFASTAAALADTVIPPEWQGTLANTPRMIVLPSGVIGTIPFSILPVGSTRSSLIDTTAVSMLPGLQPNYDEDELAGPSISKNVAWNLNNNDRILIVGNPAFPQDDPKWIWPSLPGAENEANLAGNYFPGITKLIGKTATIGSVKQYIGKADYLYFATHGMANQANPLDGGYLVFADGYLTAREIQEQQLHASLVVLSACQTGLGGAHEGGIIGLSRAFQIAGVPSVVMSLWSVDDTATALLMENFMRHLKTYPPDLALHKAMLETRERYPQPDKWGAFSHFGWPISNRTQITKELR